MPHSTARERAEQIQRIFDEVVDLAPEERAARLNETCGDDPDLRQEVEALLAAFDDPASDVREALEALHAAANREYEAARHDLTGQSLARYQIEEKLGGGGMGIVYRARDTKLGRSVALKFLPPHLSLDDQTKARFVHEAKAASALDHPNICRVHDIDETAEGRLFISMAYYRGETLKMKIARGPLPNYEAIGYVSQLAEALRAAHEAGIVHRDVKPANVMVTERGRVKLVDFGLAKAQDVSLTKTGTTLGTAAYMSPEQARGGDVDHRTDLWSLGVVLYEMLTGERPFRGDYPDAVIYAILHEKPRPLRSLRHDLPSELEGVLDKLLQKQPQDRYQHAGEAAAALKESRQGPGGRPPVTRSELPRSYVLGAVAAVVVLLLAAVATFVFLTPAPAEHLRSVAVLPFENLSGDPDEAYLVDGMHDAVIGELAGISGLDKVISRRSALRYKESEKRISEIAGELDVDAVVEGAVLQAGDRIRLNVQLIDAAAEQTLWADSYERDVRHVLALQSDVARAIAEEIQVTLSPDEEERIAATSPVDPSAYQAYARAKFLHLNFGADTIDREFQFLQAAIAADSTWAPPYALLAQWHLLSTYWGADPLETGPKARAAAVRAIELDSTLAEAHNAFGLYNASYAQEWEAAEASYRRALDLNPGSALIRLQYATFLSNMGHRSEALRHARRAIELDPVSNVARGQLGLVLEHAGRYEEAAEQAREALALDPDYHAGYYRLAWAQFESGQEDEAVATMERALERFEASSVDPLVRSWMAEVYAHTGRHLQARDLLENVLQSYDTRYISPSQVAGIFIGLGETEEAMEWLWRAYESRAVNLLFHLVLPRYRAVRTEPDFQRLVRLLDPPESTGLYEVPDSAVEATGAYFSRPTSTPTVRTSLSNIAG